MPQAGVGLYVHVPFCAIKCHYCDFACYTGLDALMADYVGALEREMAHYSGLDVASVYLGGGTPSLLPPTLMQRLLAAIRAHFDLRPGAETTFEVNPGTGDRELFEVARSGGCNRVSVGVQVMDDRALAAIGRDHTVADVATCMADLRAAGFADISVDLIYGLPDQTSAAWSATIEAALGLEPQHFSVYSLQVEDRTVFGKRHREGRLRLPGEDVERDMHDSLDAALVRAGYARYEISSWCIPGHESVHNRIYWHNRPYVGLGTGAHSFFGGRRFAHGRSVKGYVALPEPPAGGDLQSRDEEMEETVFMGLRLVREGVSTRAFAERFGVDIRDVYGKVIDGLVARGMVEENADCLRLAPEAIPVANDVFAAFLRGQVSLRGRATGA
jgi:oxygen-independent coproporphyrinogen-3 oxidase